MDAKSIKCTFIRDGSDKFGYEFWDEHAESKGNSLYRFCIQADKLM